MAVYVDDLEIAYGRMIMSHMAADSTEELLAMATKIGLSHRWIQKRGTDEEHFDVSLGYKARAIRNGAIAVTARELCCVGWSRGPMDFVAKTPVPERRARRG